MKSTQTFEAITKDRLVRLSVAQESHLMFFHIYFPHYVKFPIAEFQKDIFRITEDRSNKLACILAFRGSGKSTLVTLSYVLWSILGIQQKKFVLILCQTQSQARQQVANIRRELESNRLLKSDLGPFREEIGGEWAMSSLVFKNTNARIMVASVDQSIRGVRHYEHRPNLIVLDDIEDLNSCKTYEGRSKSFNWFTREIIPLGDIGTRIILVGNLVHGDCLMMRLKEKMDEGELSGIFRRFPLLAADGTCLWPGKFDTPEKIEELRMSVGNPLAWWQEYLLEVVTDTTQVIHKEWIQTYPFIPEMTPVNHYRFTATGVDLAISEKAAADCTAMVSVRVFGFKEQMRIFVLPNPVNAHLSFHGSLECIRNIHNVHGAKWENKIFVEDVAFQRIVIEQCQAEHLPVEGFSPGNTDKRTRLAFVSHLVQNGQILFPEHGAEDLIRQIVGLGMERFDDLAGAFGIVILKSIESHHGAHTPLSTKRSPMITSGYMTMKF